MDKPMNRTPVKGKVARILNERELVINVGAKDGVVRNMRFKVLDSKGEDIKDPDTGLLLGSLHRTKIEVIVSEVQDQLSIARTFKKNPLNAEGLGLVKPKYQMKGLSELAELFLASQKTITPHETLRTPENFIKPLDEKDSFVKTGDIVEEIMLSTDVDEGTVKRTLRQSEPVSNS